MNKYPDIRALRTIADPRGDQGERRLSLIIGDLARWIDQGRNLPAIDGFHFADFCDISTPLLRELDPVIVLSPLIAEQFDAIDVAQRLVLSGYCGRYCAVTEHVGNRDAVRMEIQNAAPTLNVDLFVMPPEAANF